MEEVLEEISAKLEMEPRQVLEHIKALSKTREMEDLRARIDSLLKENAELKTQVANRDEKLKEAEALTVTAFEEKVRAQEECKKAVTMARKFHAFVGFSGDVVTKARLYDESMKKPEVVPAPKVLRMLVDYIEKVEKLLGELRILLQHGEQGEEAGPSERRPELEPEPVSRPEPVPSQLQSQLLLQPEELPLRLLNRERQRLDQRQQQHQEFRIRRFGSPFQTH